MTHYPILTFTPAYSPFLLVLVSLFTFSACQPPPTYPRPWGYHRIELPKEVQYLTFENESCPFTFDYPSTGKITHQQTDSCWINIYYPAYKATWHITHRNTAKTNKPADLHYEEWRKLIYAHSKKASQIKDELVERENGKGFFYEVYGNVGTPAQFFFRNHEGTDIVMMNCYFQTATKNDSLAPVIAFMKEEMKGVLASIDWNGVSN